jgi:competence protein ComEA
MAENIDPSGTGKKIDLNRASKDDLKEIKGVSDTLAEKIIEYRSEHGGFKNLDDLDEVEGFSETRKEEMQQSVIFGEPEK